MSPDVRDRGGWAVRCTRTLAPGNLGLLVADGGTPPDQELRLRRFRQAHPDIEIILRGPWQAVITEPDGERTIVRWELRDLLDQLDKRLGPPAGDECLT